MFSTTIFLFITVVTGVFSAYISDIPVYEKSNLYNTQLSSRMNSNTPIVYMASQPIMQRFQTPVVYNQLNQLLLSSIISTYVILIEYAKMIAYNQLTTTQNAYPLNIYHNNMDYSQNTLTEFQRLPPLKQLLQIQQQQMDEQQQFYDKNREKSKLKFANNPYKNELIKINNPVIENESLEAKQKILFEDQKSKEIQDRDLVMYEEKHLKQKQEEELRQREEEELQLREEEKLRLREEEELRLREEEELRLREKELRQREEQLRLRKEEELRLREKELKLREKEELRLREENELRLKEEEELKLKKEELRLKEEEELRLREEELRLKEKEELSLREEEELRQKEEGILKQQKESENELLRQKKELEQEPLLTETPIEIPSTINPKKRTVIRKYKIINGEKVYKN